MGLSTHVLGTMHGTPAAGMRVTWYVTEGDTLLQLKQLVLNQDGRNPDGLLLEATEFQRGTHRLVVELAAYFKTCGVIFPETNFLNQVSLDFGVTAPEQHYHVPLQVSPWSYSTDRGREGRFGLFREPNQLRTEQIFFANIGLSRKLSHLSFCQRIQLELAAFVPQPSVGVGDPAHADGRGVGLCQTHGAFNLGHHLRRVIGGAHPVGAGDMAFAVHFNLQHPHGVEQGRHLATVNPLYVSFIQVAGRITPVVTRRAGVRHIGRGSHGRRRYHDRCRWWRRCRHAHDGRGGQGGGCTPCQKHSQAGHQAQRIQFEV